MSRLTKTTLAILAIGLAATAHPALAQSVRLDCEVKQYGEYAHGEAREVAESWIPPTSTHVIHAGKSIHVDWSLVGSGRATGSRIYFQYPLYSETNLRRVVKYTYLRKTGVLIGFLDTGANTWTIQTRGTCTSRPLSPARAAEFF